MRCAALHRITALLVLLLYLPSCAQRRAETRPVPELFAKKPPSAVRVTRVDSSRVVLHEPILVGDSLTGITGARRPPKVSDVGAYVSAHGSWLTVALADVRRIETSHENWIVPAIVVGVVAAYVGVGLAVASTFPD